MNHQILYEFCIENNIFLAVSFFNLTKSTFVNCKLHRIVKYYPISTGRRKKRLDTTVINEQVNRLLKLMVHLRLLRMLSQVDETTEKESLVILLIIKI